MALISASRFGSSSAVSEQGIYGSAVIALLLVGWCLPLLFTLYPT
jgi:hypothetical protein